MANDPNSISGGEARKKKGAGQKKRKVKKKSQLKPLDNPKPVQGENDYTVGSGASDQRVLQTVAAMYKGPVPPPSHIESYEKTLPGAADRFFCMAEEEQRSHHRSKKHEQSNETLKICFSFITVLAFVVCVLILTLNGFPWIGIIFVLPSVVVALIKFYSLLAKKKKKD